MRVDAKLSVEDCGWGTWEVEVVVKEERKGRDGSSDRGYVNNMTSGVIVWRVKYAGNVAFCKVENWARGSARKATMPPMKDWKTVLPRSVP
jgi:hypothetical protein